MSYFRAQPLSLVAQHLHLQRRFAGNGEIRRSQLRWDQVIRPHSLAHAYRCRLEHTLGDYPRVFCVDPKLSEIAGARKLPHARSRTEPIELCLFMYRRECWNDTMKLADVVVPLTAYWLAHFEEWLFSGHWRGGGTHEIEAIAPTELPIFHEELAATAAATLSIGNAADAAA